MNHNKSNVAERVAAHKERKLSAGYKKISIFVRSETDEKITKMATGATKGEVVDELVKKLGV